MTRWGWMTRARGAHAKFLVLLALATAALGCATAAASAEVEPQLGRCVKVAKGTGVYGTSNCTTIKSKKNSYVWMPGAVKTGVTFTANTSKLELEEEGFTVTCTSDAGSGSYEGDTRVTGIAITYHGCKVGTKSCATEGAEAGAITTEPLEGEYVKIHKENRVGLLLSPVSGHSGAYMSFTCGEDRFAASGSLLVDVIGNRMKTDELGLEDRAKEDIQSPISYINAEGTTVETFLSDVFLNEPLAEPEPMAIESFGKQTSEETLELNTKL